MNLENQVAFWLNDHGKWVIGGLCEKSEAILWQGRHLKRMEFAMEILGPQRVNELLREQCNLTPGEILEGKISSPAVLKKAVENIFNLAKSDAGIDP